MRAWRSVLVMSGQRHSNLTPEQQAELEAVLSGKPTNQEALSPAVLRALEEQIRPVAVTPPRAPDLATRTDVGEKDLLTAIEGALLIGVSLSTFARSIEPHVEKVKTPGGARFRRAELVVVGAARELARRKRRAAGL